MAGLTPSAQDVIACTELNRYILGTASDQQWRTLIDPYIQRAIVRTALAVGEATYRSATLTAFQRAALNEAICNRTASLVLRSAALRKVTGTHEPLLVEDADQIIAVADMYDQQALECDSLLQTGTETTATFARPAVSVSSPSIGIRTPYPQSADVRGSECDDRAGWTEVTCE